MMNKIIKDALAFLAWLTLFMFLAAAAVTGLRVYTGVNRCEALKQHTKMEIIYDPVVGCLTKLPNGTYVPFDQLKFTGE